jgi:hypothetical protein
MKNKLILYNCLKSFDAYYHLLVAYQYEKIYLILTNF